MAPAAWDPGPRMDSAYDPTANTPSHIKDAEEARWMDKFAQNAEKTDWFESMTPQQKADHLAKFRKGGM